MINKVDEPHASQAELNLQEVWSLTLSHTWNETTNCFSSIHTRNLLSVSSQATTNNKGHCGHHSHIKWAYHLSPCHSTANNDHHRHCLHVIYLLSISNYFSTHEIYHLSLDIFLLKMTIMDIIHTWNSLSIPSHSNNITGQQGHYPPMKRIIHLRLFIHAYPKIAFSGTKITKIRNTA